MPVEMREAEIDGVIVLRLQGRLTLGAESAAVQDSFADLLNRGKTRVIVHLHDVSFIDSTGLGLLVLGHSTFQAAGGAMKLLHLNRRHLQLLILTKLSTIFEVFDEERSAIDSFFPDRDAKRFDILEFVKRRDEDTERS